MNATFIIGALLVGMFLGVFVVAKAVFELKQERPLNEYPISACLAAWVFVSLMFATGIIGFRLLFL